MVMESKAEFGQQKSKPNLVLANKQILNGKAISWWNKACQIKSQACIMLTPCLTVFLKKSYFKYLEFSLSIVRKSYVTCNMGDHYSCTSTEGLSWFSKYQSA